MTFLASQSIIHILAKMSINNGIDKSLMNSIAMKNEYYFPVFIPTQVNKHYFASIAFREGNVFDVVKREIKGVHLKNSNSPKFIINAAKSMMNDIMDTVMSGKKISMVEYLKRVADIERSIYSGIAKGDKTFFRAGVIKTPDSYNSEKERSPYYHHMLWNTVFASKYGTIAEPPYDIISINTVLENTSSVTNFINSLEDKKLAARLAAFLTTHEKKRLPTILLPAPIITVHGIPKEIQNIIDSRSIVVNLCKIFYLILETLGFNILNKNSTSLLSDFY
jgi:hypothetical protein